MKKTPKPWRKVTEHKMIAWFLVCMAASPLVDFASDEGIARLERSQHKIDFFHLANQFESQSNKFFCGATSAAIVLNTLRPDAANKPQDPSLLDAAGRRVVPKGIDPLFSRYTQNNAFKGPKTRLQALGQHATGAPPDIGLQLRQLQALLVANGLNVQLRIVDDTLPTAQIKKELVDNLGRANDYVLVNYDRQTLGQVGGGHISPLAAYDKASDSFLIMDVNPNKAGFVWVPADLLIAAMHTYDTVENRGFLLLSEGTQ